VTSAGEASESELSPFRRRRVALPARGGEMAVLEAGPSDRPVDLVFVHANGFNARTYRTILAPLARSARVLAADLRGHGLTDLPVRTDGRRSWLDHRDDLRALLEAEGVRGAVLSGHSMGGVVCLLAARAAPAAARGLVLFDPVILSPAMTAAVFAGTMRPFHLVDQALARRAIFPSREAALQSYRGRGAFRTWSDEQLDDYVADGFRPRGDGQVELRCPPEWEASNFRSHAHDCWAALRETTCPVRIIAAELDSPCAAPAHAGELPPDRRVTVEVAPGTSHFIPMERPELARDAIKAALDR